MKRKMFWVFWACAVLVLLAVACAAPEVQETKPETYDNGIECVWIPSYLSRCIDRTTGYVCYEADGDIECYKLGE